MTVVESVKSTIGFGDGTGRFFHPIDSRKERLLTYMSGVIVNNPATATRQEMSDARLPLAYRDSCAHLLIPLNRCRQAEYYLPWKCEVGYPKRAAFYLR